MGYNNNGALGDLSTTNRSSPVQAGSATNWSKLAVSGQNVVAINTSGELWVWGYGNSGINGQGNTTSLSDPTQVGSLTNWSKVAASNGECAFAVKTDGTLWAWGANWAGQLGLNDTTYRSSPVQIGALTTWNKISTQHKSSSAIKTDGTLWSWGYGAEGRLGHGNTTTYSSPKQIGSLTTWVSLGRCQDDKGIRALKTPS